MNALFALTYLLLYDITEVNTFNKFIALNALIALNAIIAFIALNAFVTLNSFKFT